jgi:hypothetical protein
LETATAAAGPMAARPALAPAIIARIFALAIDFARLRDSLAFHHTSRRLADLAAHPVFHPGLALVIERFISLVGQRVLGSGLVDEVVAVSRTSGAAPDREQAGAAFGAGRGAGRRLRAINNDPRSAPTTTAPAFENAGRVTHRLERYLNALAPSPRRRRCWACWAR